LPVRGSREGAYLDEQTLLAAGAPPPGSFVGNGRGSHLLGGQRAAAVSTVSTVVFIGAVIALFVFAPGAAAVRQHVLQSAADEASVPRRSEQGALLGWQGLILNIEMFLIAEVLILFCALVIAVLRQLRNPVLFPFRMLAVVYTDVFRGVPLIIVIYGIGFGAPALYIRGISTQSDFVYGIAALVLSYSAYVAEVYRAGINSVHQSQVAAARSLGLSQWKSLRFVVLPQAVRTVIPPLLNDFIACRRTPRSCRRSGP